MYDVIVVGAGPGGAMAAKKCAESGLKTLLLEKKTLPRDKVCSGMVMGRMAQEIVKEEFGAIPDKVLTTPKQLLGYMLHVAGAEPRIVAQRMPYAWRRDLDFWMVQMAKQFGVEVRDKARVTRAQQVGESCLVEANGERLETKYMIGADGAKSTIRGLVCPEVRLTYRTAYRGCYDGELALDRNYFHLFFPFGKLRPRFDVIFKEKFYIIEGSLKDVSGEIVNCLRPYGFSEEQAALWKDGCPSGARFAVGFSASSFIPAKGNILLVGDAAKVQLPVTGEGIGMALKSGLLAARSVVEAMTEKRNAADIYLTHYASLQDALKKLAVYDKKAEEAASSGAEALMEAFAEGFRATVRIR